MIRFGPSGISSSFYEQGYKSSVQMPAWLKNMGLDAYEYSCSKGVNIKKETALEVGREAAQNGIFMSVHAPYFINMASEENERRRSSIKYIMQTLEAAQWMGAERIVVHTGSCTGMDRKRALDIAEEVMVQVINEADAAGYRDIHICPEVLGKNNQLGTLEEIIHLCSLDERLIPTVDFGHLYARNQGGFEKTEDFDRVFQQVYNRLGNERLKYLHIHFSRVEFTKGGEKKHWTLDDTRYGPEFLPLAQAIYKRDMTPVIICESRDRMAEDALTLKNIYKSIVEGECKP